MTSVQGSLPFKLAVLKPGMAAEVIGLNLNHAIDDGLRQIILETFYKFPVLVFRDQTLDKRAQIAFSKCFGALEGHVNRDFRSDGFPAVHEVSNLDLNTGKPTAKLENRGDYHWHTDKSYLLTPSLATLLHAVTLPPESRSSDARKSVDDVPFRKFRPLNCAASTMESICSRNWPISV